MVDTQTEKQALATELLEVKGSFAGPWPLWFWKTRACCIVCAG
jgi:hypothetical protein